MLDNVKKEHMNILHILVVVGLLYLVWKGHQNAKTDQDVWMHRAGLALGVLLVACNLWCLWKKYGGSLSKVAGSGQSVSNEAEQETDSD